MNLVTKIKHHLETCENRKKFACLIKKDFWNEILLETKYLPICSTAGERAFHILNNLSDIPCCPVCTNLCHWRVNQHKYTETCSCKCHRYFHAEAIRNTNINRYGGPAPVSSSKVKAKMEATCEKRFGVANASSSPIIKEKRRLTVQKRYGVDNVSYLPEIVQKIINYQLSVSPEQRLKIISSSKRNWKLYEFNDKSTIKVQGYEPRALFLLEQQGLTRTDIICGGKKEIPIIRFGKNKIHYPDIFLPNENKIIEVKSLFLFKKDHEIIFNKKQAAILLGYSYEIWVFDQYDQLPTIY